MKKFIIKHFYGLPDKLVAHTDARFRRTINFWLLVLWLTLGLLLWVILLNTLWFIGFMSLYALWATHLGALSAETPVEAEDSDTPIDAGGDKNE